MISTEPSLSELFKIYSYQQSEEYEVILSEIYFLQLYNFEYQIEIHKTIKIVYHHY
jgi:hypothetical protein